MQYHFVKMSEEHREPIGDIFNYFIENSFAAYPVKKVGYEIFDKFLSMSKGFPAIVVKTEAGKIVGFAFLHAYHPAESFKKTAEITYFIMPEHTRKGIGKNILDHFVEEAKKLNITTILASISSLNSESINFHLKFGFKECGRFRDVGKKCGRNFDMVWMQKML